MEKDRLVLIKNVSKEFDGVEVLSNINLYIKRNEFVTLLGPSGCGKTTLLRLLGGFEAPTSGDILFEGKSIVDVPPYKRRLNTVFQRYALFPHYDVFDNVAFGLKIKKLPKDEIKKKVEEKLALVGLSGYEKRSVDTLSGGQMQRVAIARALVNEPELLLLDEPLGALDLKFRKEMQLELKRMQKQLGITFVYVTHDQEEALSMSDTIAVMDSGRILQIGTPQDIYNEPINSFVADFIGESNIIPGIMKEDYLVHFSDKDFRCVDRGYNNDDPIMVVVRPEDVKLVPPTENTINGVVTSIVFMGVHYEIRLVDDRGFEWLIQSIHSADVGSRLGIHLEPDDIHIMDRSQYDSIG
ncbi:MAG: ABC transporter ATP-binding protein [Clostridia bacterium]|jgi:spermidine/putrescine transport system ATP-binding protein|nr:ABC transporter ATP-binding protein [Clostridia bacterium]MBR0438316.1 ABC transporter ATP-binding protein [Clostridia bacterium]MBR3563728.1 ABC transporter ATP-binding protein [Clostridia bacterium]MBR4623592.1 ABC transporter ATP-binding protein [Clostridia bacterium]MBR6136179.1 ABC transporter ATP-binding protein [Clostridia bacterium]